jgi:CheY-like chemotaxis protein
LAQVLIIDDNPGDVFLIKSYFSELSEDISFAEISDGASAAEYLCYLSSSDAAKENMPSLVMLDLNLPHINGFDLLQHIKNDLTLRRMPVVMFTSSSDPAHIEKAYSLQVNSYMVKPHDLNKYESFIGVLYDFWCNTAAKFSVAG